MAIYQPSFVDTTGYTSGIAAGINRAMEYRLRQDRLFANSMDDLRRSYDTKRMRTGDVPRFLGAFDQHKNALIAYTRVNNSNASADEIYQASQAVEKSRMNMDNVFSKSSEIFGKLKLFNSASQSMFKNGIEPVGEFKDAFNKLSNVDLDLINDDDININPFDYKTLANADDLKDIDSTILKNIVFSQKDEAVLDANGVPVAFSIQIPSPGKTPGKTYNIPWMAKKEKRDPNAVAAAIQSNFNLPGGEKIKNYASNQINNLAKSLSIDETNPSTTPAQVSEKRMAEATFGKIKASFPSIKDVKDILPSQIYAVERGLLEGRIKGFYYNDDEFKLAMQRITSDFGMDMRSNAAAMAMQNAALQATNAANSATMRLLTFALGGGTTIAPEIIDLLKNKGITLNLEALGIINEKKLTGGKKADPIAEALKALKNKKGK
jgi:hypothetical protein